MRGGSGITTNLTGFFMNKIDFKTGHRDIVNRRKDHWTDGWSRAESWWLGFAWGCAFILAAIVFWY